MIKNLPQLFGNGSPTVELTSPCHGDSCSHEFCFNCLWNSAHKKAECPLCKIPLLSIRQHIRSEKDYDEFFIPHPLTRLSFTAHGRLIDYRAQHAPHLAKDDKALKDILFLLRSPGNRPLEWPGSDPVLTWSFLRKISGVLLAFYILFIGTIFLSMNFERFKESIKGSELKFHVFILWVGIFHYILLGKYESLARNYPLNYILALIVVFLSGLAQGAMMNMGSISLHDFYLEAILIPLLHIVLYLIYWNKHLGTSKSGFVIVLLLFMMSTLLTYFLYENCSHGLLLCWTQNLIISALVFFIVWFVIAEEFKRLLRGDYEDRLVIPVLTLHLEINFIFILITCLFFFKE